ncbi:hypothetical protein WJX81_002375 [Elliptochloris bilobata]|uniref:CobW C-terminal domain-containing protein n=1 Tax=Elliptochloris bilobata TaxID=381761 RepID=A0AAW1RX22_9CHLO
MRNAGDLRVAVIVNDVAAVNIDAAFVESRVRREDGGELVALANGCVCCSLREDLTRAVLRLAAERRFDHLLIEATGISEPMPVAAALSGGAATAAGPYVLDTLATVVDAPRFLADVAEARALGEDDLGDGEGDGRTLADLLVEQVEFADVVLVNKVDRLAPGELPRLLATLSALNPGATLLPTEHGQVAPSELVGARRFDAEAAAERPGWLREINESAEARAGGASAGGPGHMHGHSGRQAEAQKYGVSTFVYHARRPFHPGRLVAALEQPWPGVLRSKGFFWLATRHNVAGLWQSAGGAWRGDPGAAWAAATGERADGADEAGWHPRWGDRAQELAWIGVDMNEPALRAMLDDALLTEEETAAGPHVWAALDDPLPPWEIEDDAGE